MSDKNGVEPVHVFWIAIFCLAMGFLFGGLAIEGMYRKDAVDKGYARWIITDNGGSTKWEWVPK
jgi:hypothetical protein